MQASERPAPRRTEETTIERRSRSGEYRALLDRIPDAIVLRQRERLVYVNTSFASLLGASRESLLGVHIGDLVHPDDRDLVSTRTRTMQAENAPSTVRFRHARGGYVVLEVDPAHVIHFDGEPARLLVARDPSSRQREQARLLATERMASMGMVAAGVLHDINNPLAYVLTNIEHAMTSLDRDEVEAEVFTALEAAREGAERVREVARDLRLATQSDDPNEPVAVRTVIDSAIRIGWGEIRHRAQIVREDGDVPPVRGGSSRLVQVFMNLLVNSAQSFPEGRASQATIRVTSRAEGDRVIVRLEDNGPGIREEVLDRLFEPFVTTKAVGLGAGLGLYLCQGILDSIGGAIRVESAPGRGTAVEVALPRAVETKRASDEARPKVPAKGPISILLVDDEAALLAALARNLKKDHVVATASSAGAALARIRAGERFDLILTDVHMPDTNGVELYEAIRAIDANLAERVVLMTGGAFTHNVHDLVARLGVPTIEKPFTMASLRTWIPRWIENAEGARTAGA